MNEPLKIPEKSEMDSVREFLLKYLRYWYLFVLAVLLAYGISRMYLKYSTNVYNTIGTIIIKEDKGGGRSIDLSDFSNFKSLFKSYSGGRINNELAILKSNRLISQTLESLALNTHYESVGNVKNFSLHRVKPIEVKYLSFNGNFKKNGVPKLYFEILSDREYKLTNNSGSISARHSFGEQVSLPYGDILVVPFYEDPERFNKNIGVVISAEYVPTEKLANSYKSRLKVENNIDNSNVVMLAIRGTNPEKAEDFINELIKQYNDDAATDMSMVAQKTSEFIAERLRIIQRELDSVEDNKAIFKSDNRIVSMESEAELSLTGAYEFDKRQLDVETRIELVNSVMDYINTSEEMRLLPENIGIQDQEVSSSIQAYNALVLQRNRLLEYSTPKNPIVLNLDSQIGSLRNNIGSGLESSKRALNIELRNINSEGFKIDSKIRKIPTKEKAYRGIERQQNIKEQLYLFLLRQREEASLSLAATSTKAKVVDFVYTPKAPIAPNRRFITLIALGLGLLLPFCILYLKFLFQNKVMGKSDVDGILTGQPYLGEIPKIGKDQSEFIQQNDRTMLAECFRILRTNLQYLLKTKNPSEEKGNTVFVTSSIKGEGKTLVAYNLALALSFTGKRTVIVGADIRNPQLHRYLDEKKYKSHPGLTEYVVDPTVQVDDLIIKGVENTKLDIILSGIIPPNPAELLMQSRTDDFFNSLKEQYDYVVVDTAPCMLVTDTIIINKLADVTIYVIKAGYTRKRLLEFTKSAIQDGRLKDVATVINSVVSSNYGYGNKYGYGYTYVEEEPNWLQRIFRRS